jgi:hypothetical protein
MIIGKLEYINSKTAVKIAYNNQKLDALTNSQQQLIGFTEEN